MFAKKFKVYLEKRKDKFRTYNKIQKKINNFTAEITLFIFQYVSVWSYVYIKITYIAHNWDDAIFEKKLCVISYFT